MRLIPRAIPLIIFLVSVGCAASTSQPRTERGTLTVGVTTTGAPANTLTFRVTIEPAGIEGPVKADAGVFTRGSVPPGTHTVRLLDVPAACRVEGGTERTVSIAARGSAVVRFAVQCR
jgi:hypothetical protein